MFLTHVTEDPHGDLAMHVERALRLMAGLVMLIGVALTQYVSPWFLLLIAFVGLNLLAPKCRSLAAAPSVTFTAP